MTSIPSLCSYIDLHIHVCNLISPPDNIFQCRRCTDCVTDKRKVHIIKNDILLDAVGDFIVDRVEELAVEAISKKDSFSISIGSGTTVKPLVALADRNVDLSKVHIFFGNERTEGDAAGKCSKRYVSVIRCIVLIRNSHMITLYVRIILLIFSVELMYLQN